MCWVWSRRPKGLLVLEGLVAIWLRAYSSQSKGILCCSLETKMKGCDWQHQLDELHHHLGDRSLGMPLKSYCDQTHTKTTVGGTPPTVRSPDAQKGESELSTSIPTLASWLYMQCDQLPHIPAITAASPQRLYLGTESKWACSPFNGISLKN